MYLDLYTSEQARHVDRLVSLGATRVHEWPYPADADFVVMRDPDGNEFCVISQALRWAVQAVAKAGTIGIIGVYPPRHESFPIGAAMNRNLTVKMGNCNHRRYVPGLLSRIAAGGADPTTAWTQQPSPP